MPLEDPPQTIQALMRDALNMVAIRSQWEGFILRPADLALDGDSGYSNWQAAPADHKEYFDSIPSPMSASGWIARGLYLFVFCVFSHDII